MKKLLSTNIFWLLIICISISLSACKKESDKHPQILTEDPLVLDLNTVEFKGKIVEKGGFSVLDYGFIYGSYSNIDDQNGMKVSLGKEATQGDYSTVVENLLRDIYSNTIYVRSFITNSNGTAYGAVKSLELPIPSSSSVSPTAGKVGDLITIAGQFYTDDTAKMAIYFQDIKATIKTIDPNKITVEIPSGISASHNSQINIALQIGQQRFTLSYDFRIQALVTDFTPKTGMVGSTITLIGENLPNYYYGGDQSLKIFFDETEANYAYSEQPTFYVPPTTAEKSKVAVALNGVRNLLPGEFTLTKPTVSSVSAQSVLPGESFEIHGTGYSWEYLPVIKLGNYTLPIENIYNDVIIVSVPSEVPTGTYALTLTSGPFVITANSAFKVTGYSATGFTPKKGGINTVVNIAGSFNQYANYDISFGSVRTTGTAATNNNLQVNVPYGLDAGKVKITVHFPNKDVKLSEDFEIIGPSISSFSPASGVPGTVVTISGQGFSPDTWNTKVRFGTIEANITSVTSTQIKALVPSNVNTGEMKINVETNGQTVTSKEDFTVKN